MVIINECSKLAQKEYKSRHDGIAKVNHREFCKKFKFDYMNKSYMHNPNICPEEWCTQTPLEFWQKNGSLNLSQTTRP